MKLYANGELIGGLDILKEMVAASHLAGGQPLKIQLGFDDTLFPPPPPPSLEERIKS